MQCYAIQKKNEIYEKYNKTPDIPLLREQITPQFKEQEIQHNTTN